MLLAKIRYRKVNKTIMNTINRILICVVVICCCWILPFWQNSFANTRIQLTSGCSYTDTLSGSDDAEYYYINDSDSCTHSLSIQSDTPKLFKVVAYEIFYDASQEKNVQRTIAIVYHDTAHPEVDSDFLNKILNCGTTATLKISPYWDRATSYTIKYSSTKHNDSYTIKQNATCVESGVAEYKCEKCGRTKNEVISPTGTHQYGNWIITKGATCAQEGEKKQYCTICGKTNTVAIEKTEHDYCESILKEATCTSNGTKRLTCNYCGESITKTIDEKGHEWDKGVETKVPTCTDAGNIMYRCTRDNCNQIKNVPISSTGHQWNEGVIISEPNDLQDGVIEYTCGACGIKKQQSIGRIINQGKWDYGNGTWIFYSNNTLVVSNTTGSLNTSINEDEIPWNDYKNDIESVVVSSEISDLGYQAFSNCSKLKSVILPESLEIIGYHCFKGCSSLEQIHIPDSVTTIGIEAFNGCTSLHDICLPSNLKTIELRAFKDCKKIEFIEIPDGTTKVSDDAFSGCVALSYVSIPESVTYMGQCAFQNCSSLRDIDIPGSIENIGCNTFDGCKNLQNVKVNNGVKSIGANAFKACVCLKKLIIPESVISLGLQAFYGMNSNGYIWLEGDPPSADNDFLVSEKKYSFWGYEGTIVYPCNSKWIDGEIDDWETNANWKITHVGETLISCQKPTCNSKGINSYYCSACEKEYSEDIPNIEHDLILYQSKEATCTEVGWNDYYKCKNCGYSTYQEIAKTPHKYSDEWLHNENQHWKQCSCGEKSDSSNHEYGDWNTLTLPTCDKSGIKVRECRVCKYSEVKAIEENGHSWEDDYTIDKESTCTTNGLKSIHCKNCNETKDIIEISALGHKLTKHDAVQATATTSGNSEYYSCEYCLKYFSDAAGIDEINKESWIIPATGYSDNESDSSGGSYSSGEQATTKTITNATIAQATYEYTGNDITPDVIVKDSEGVVLTKNKDYTVKYSNNKNPGTATITVSGAGEYSSSTPITIKFTIIKNSIKTAEFEEEQYTYTGSAIRPEVMVTDSNGETLIEGKNYTVAYSNNKNPGIANATVTGTNDCEGTATATFRIVPKGTSLTSVPKGKKSFTAKWKKQSTQTTGYILEYSVNKDFIGAKSKTIKSSKTTKLTVKSLKAKKKYYVRIATYKNVDGQKYQSDWSKVKAVKTK